MLSHHNRAENKPIDGRISDFLSLVEKYYTQQHETLFCSKKIALSSKRLNMLSRQELGIIVKQLLQQRILLEAKRKISEGNKPFKNISLELGFKDTSYFSRFFRQNAGITPQQFRDLNTLK